MAADPAAASVNITQQPQDYLLVPTGSSVILLDENFDSGGGVGWSAPGTARGGPWTYGDGSWSATSVDPCGTPDNVTLVGPQVTLAERRGGHPHVRSSLQLRFDGSTRWDGGQVQMSINGGAWQAVPANAFSANGYVGTITGTGVLNGQPGFNDNSAGFTSGQFIRSVAVLGSFDAGTQIAVRFLAAWDECSQGNYQPAWQIDMVQMTSDPNIKTATFSVAANGSVQGAYSTPLFYQWERSGNGGVSWAKIAGANSSGPSRLWLARRTAVPCSGSR